MDGTPGRLSAEPSFWREGSGSPVLLIPGMISSPQAWKGIAPDLVQRYQLVSMDLHGFLPPGRRSATFHAQCWRDLMDYLELPAAHVVAHGSGCQVALLLALESPYRTLSLSVINPVLPRAESSTGVQATWHLHTLIHYFETKGIREVRKPEHVRYLQQVIGQQTLASFSEVGIAAPAVEESSDEYDLDGLSDLDFPVNAINGTGESPERCELTRRLYGRAPHFQYRQIPGVQNNCLREAPTLVAKALYEFLQDAENPVAHR